MWVQEQQLKKIFLFSKLFVRPCYGCLLKTTSLQRFFKRRTISSVIKENSEISFELENKYRKESRIRVEVEVWRVAGMGGRGGWGEEGRG